MNPNDKLDHTLDKALNEYRDAEPLSGMEDRILRRIGTQPKSSSQRWVWIVAAAAAAAVIVVVLWMGLGARPHQPIVGTNVTQPVQEAASSSQLVPRATSLSESHSPGSKRAISRRHYSAITPQIANATIAKAALKQFPAPAPMTTEEHALLALARTHPGALLASRDEADKLTIAPIDIKPLVPESGAPQGEQ